MLKANEIISALRKAGFVPIRHDDGRLVTVPSHSGKDIGHGLLRKILRDAEMNLDDLLKLLD